MIYFKYHKDIFTSQFYISYRFKIGFKQIIIIRISIFQVYPRGYVCRDETSECDLPEVCNGYTGDCPKDLYVKNTVPCSGGKGYCINGICPTMDQQCEMLWGRSAKKSDPQCFSEYNSRGTQTGNCGKTQYNSYKPCEME